MRNDTIRQLRTGARALAFLVALIWVQGLFAQKAEAHWTSLYNRGTPVHTYYLGDKLAYIFEFAINTDTTGWTVDYGVGTTTDGSGWSWYSGAWSYYSDPNRVWKSTADQHTFSSVGTWYYSGRFETGGYIEYASDDWSENRTTLSANQYFTVSALNEPGSQSAGNPSASSIDLSWSLNAQSHAVMIVRNTDNSFDTPSGGTSYSEGGTVGDDDVVYKGSGTSVTDSSLTSDTTYYYKFYSVNNDYYSSGVTDSETTSAASTEPAISYGPSTLSYTMIRGAVPANQSFSVTNNGDATLVYTNTVTYDGQASGWLSLSAPGSLSSGASEAITVSVTESNLVAGTYYATNTITGNQTNGVKTVVVDLTVSDPDDPTISSVTLDGTHSASRMDLSWSKNGAGHDVMIVRSDDASFTAPSDGVVYNDSQSIDGDPVIFKGGATTPIEDSGLAAGTTYYYKFYSEHYGYYSAGVVSNVTTALPQTQNRGGGAVGAPSVTVHLGDTHDFSCDSWASIDGNLAKWRVVIDTDADLSDGSNGSYTPSYAEQESKTNTSARFTDTGTWYWGMQVDYGSPHGDGFWYVADNGSWVDMATTPTSTLTVDVQALPVVTSQSAVTNATNPTNEIDLAWTPAPTPTVGNYQVIVVRKAGSAPSAPSQGTTYNQGDPCGGGTVVYKGFDSSTTDTGLDAGTTYHYAFYSENYSYYSPVASASEETAGSGAPFVPVPTVFRFH